MTATTEAVRARAFLPLECDIPREQTIAEYRARRQEPRRRGRVGRLRRIRRSSR